MTKHPVIKSADCRIYVASPVEYDECVALVETNTRLVFTVTDETRSGECNIEVATSGDGVAGWSMSLRDLRAALDEAERRLSRGA